MAFLKQLVVVWLLASLAVMSIWLALPTGFEVKISGIVLLKTFFAAGFISLLPSLLLVGLLSLIGRTGEQHPERMRQVFRYAIKAGLFGAALIFIQLQQLLGS